MIIVGSDNRPKKETNLREREEELNRATYNPLVRLLLPMGLSAKQGVDG